MKDITRMTNEELINAIVDKNTPYDKALLIIREGFDRFRYYVETRELPQYDTAKETYENTPY